MVQRSLTRISSQAPRFAMPWKPYLNPQNFLKNTQKIEIEICFLNLWSLPFQHQRTISRMSLKMYIKFVLVLEREKRPFSGKARSRRRKRRYHRRWATFKRANISILSLGPIEPTGRPIGRSTIVPFAVQPFARPIRYEFHQNSPPKSVDKCLMDEEPTRYGKQWTTVADGMLKLYS